MSARPEGNYEHSDARIGPLVMAGLGLALLVFGSLALSAWLSQRMQGELEAGEQVNPISGLRKAPEGPRLQAVPARELEQHRAWEERTLEENAWIDPLNGVVRIPLERAMQLTLTEGFPTRTEAPK